MCRLGRQPTLYLFLFWNRNKRVPCLGRVLHVCSQILIFLWLWRSQKLVGWAPLCPCSPLLGSSQTWAWPGNLSWLFSAADFPESPVILKVRPSHAMLKQANLISPANRSFCCKNLTKKGEGRFPWFEILSYFESKLTEHLYDFLQGGLRAEKGGFLSLIEYPHFQPQSDRSENTPSGFYQLKPGTDMWCVEGYRLLFSASGISS